MYHHRLWLSSCLLHITSIVCLVAIGCASNDLSQSRIYTGYALAKQNDDHTKCSRSEDEALGVIPCRRCIESNCLLAELCYFKLAFPLTCPVAVALSRCLKLAFPFILSYCRCSQQIFCTVFFLSTISCQYCVKHFLEKLFHKKEKNLIPLLYAF